MENVFGTVCFIEYRIHAPFIDTAYPTSVPKLSHSDFIHKSLAKARILLRTSGQSTAQFAGLYFRPFPICVYFWHTSYLLQYHTPYLRPVFDKQKQPDEAH